jgi:hypothetical protein
MVLHHDLTFSVYVLPRLLKIMSTQGSQMVAKILALKSFISQTAYFHDTMNRVISKENICNFVVS